MESAAWWSFEVHELFLARQYNIHFIYLMEYVIKQYSIYFKITAINMNVLIPTGMMTSSYYRNAGSYDSSIYSCEKIIILHYFFIIATLINIQYISGYIEIMQFQM